MATEWELRQCGAKVRYLTDEAAKRALNRFPEAEREKMVIYTCKVCWNHHIGHKGERDPLEGHR